MRRCKQCKNGAHKRVCLWCLSTTLSFPIEHLVWQKTPGLGWFTLNVLGLS